MDPRQHDDLLAALRRAARGLASRRSLRSTETLLTAFARDVLPGEKPVSLELSTERGLAALDIGVLRPDGSREDVLEDNGGALTNVVGTALRLIAVVKAGVGRFLALDEVHCWIAPDRVPAFYRVLADGARRLGVQYLAISHHDVSAFGGRFQPIAPRPVANDVKRPPIRAKLTGGVEQNVEALLLNQSPSHEDAPGDGGDAVTRGADGLCVGTGG